MNTYARIDRQTDKTETKVCPCTYPECPNAVEVNTFYAPAKARCNDHKGQTSSTIRAAVAAGAGSSIQTAPVVPVRSLADLRCPFDDRAMKLVKIEDVGERAFLYFGCSGDEGCGCAIVIKPRWAGLTVRDVPEAWRPFVEQYNAAVLATNTDERARRLAAEADERALVAQAEAGGRKKGWAEVAQEERETPQAKAASKVKAAREEGGHKAGGKTVKRKMGS